MSAPAWLTEPDKNQSVYLYAVPLILIGSIATNRYFDTTTSEGKGKVLMISGLSVMAMMVALSSLCDGSTKGVCSFVPDELR